ncbi:hypothetical protein [Planobispora takensis]|uniref:Uncharacterized protein n=1 Tax=Planobispora takensis TaxID=1367882 RepID=A0A8J3SX38_9ACTN|nr:hypothetical protein [Planobispora takensis]GII00363.1 hypothetical protein Pta02_23710 [Planobispora takensis]
MRIESRATSLSWIPSEAVKGYTRTMSAAGISHYDSPPPDVLGDLEEMRDADAFRFANRIRSGPALPSGRAFPSGPVRG